jgi:hypothetical protein
MPIAQSPTACKSVICKAPLSGVFPPKGRGPQNKHGAKRDRHVTSFLLFSQPFYPMDLYTRVLYSPADSAKVLFGESPFGALLLPYVFCTKNEGDPMTLVATPRPRV